MRNEALAWEKEQEKQRQNEARREEESSPWLKNEVKKMDQPMKQNAPLPPQRFAQDSEEEDMDLDHLRRSIPGQPSYSVAKA